MAHNSDQRHVVILLANDSFWTQSLPIESLSQAHQLHDYFRSQLDTNNEVHGWKETMMEVKA